MRCMHNYARSKVGRAALRSTSLLASSSDAKSYDILRCQNFSHTACGRSMPYHFNRVGYTFCSTWRVAENTAWGSGSYGSVRSRMSGWLHSEATATTSSVRATAIWEWGSEREPSRATAGHRSGPVISATGAGAE